MSKKILCVWSNLGAGGGEKALVNLVQQLNNNYVIDILLATNILYQPVNMFHHIFIISKKKITGVLGKLILLFKITMKLLNLSKQYDYIIVNDDLFNNKILFFTIFFMQSKIVIWSHLSKDYFAKNNKLSDVIVNILILRKSSQIVCVSEYAKNKMLDYIGVKYQDKIRVIYNIVDTDVKYSRTIADRKIKLDLKGIVNILTVARLSPEKGVDVLLYALANLIEFGVDNWQLTICGDGSEKDMLLNLVYELKLKNYVKFLGHQTDLNPYYEVCDIYVSSSHTETMSYAVVDAVCHQCYIIVTNTGAKEVIEKHKAGVIVNVGSVNEIMEALNNLITSNTYRQQFMYNKQDVLQKFDTSNIINLWLKVLT